MADQISVDQGTGGKDYPLVRPSRQLGRLIADMFLLYVDDHCEFVAPFHVSWLSGFGTAAAETAAGLLAYDITIRDAYDTVVFESADAEIVSSAWGDKTIVEWSNPEVGSICRVVFYNDALADWSSSFNPDSAVINPRVIQRKPAAVDKLIVETSTTDVTIDGDETVQYSEGYNIALKSSTDDPADGEQRGSTITVDCTPGAGLGRYPGCDPTPVLRRLAGVTPRETGDVSLTAQQCFRAELVPTSSDADSVTVQPGVIRIATSCGPCEKCEQFAAVYEAYRRLHLKYKALGRRAEAVRDQRKANILRWNTSIACRQGTTLRLLAVPIGACRLLVVGSLCNTDDGPLRNVGLQFTFEGEADSNCLLCRTARRRGNRDVNTRIPPGSWMPYNLTAVDGGYSGSFDCIDPGSQGMLAFQLYFAGAVEGQAITVNLEATGHTVPPVSMTANLNCQASYDPSCCETLGTTTTSA
jgi:hypothetical protein